MRRLRAPLKIHSTALELLSQEIAMLKTNLPRAVKTVLFASALALCGLASQAQEPMHEGPMPGHEMMAHRAMHDLQVAGATDAQKEQIHAIFKQAMADMKPAHEQLRKLHEQGEVLLAAPVIDSQAVMALHAQAQAQRDAIGTRMARALVDAAAVLTPEQRAKIHAEHQKHEAHMKEHWAEHMKDRQAASAPAH
jgi:Spy/CpxP family protein refolding chaperone